MQLNKPLMSCFGAEEPRHRLTRPGVGSGGILHLGVVGTWEVPTLVKALCALLPKNGAAYVNTDPEYFDLLWLGAEIKAKRLTPH